MLGNADIDEEAHLELNEPSEVVLQCGEADITRTLWLPSLNLVVNSAEDGNVYTHDLDTATGPTRVFQKHRAGLGGTVHIVDDVVVTAGLRGWVISWSITTGETISEFRSNGWAFFSLARLSPSELVAGTSSGEILIFSHQLGRNLALTRRVEGHRRSDGFITDITVFGDVFLSSSRNKEAKVWSRMDLTELTTLTHENRIDCVQVNESYIILGCYEGILHVHENKDGELVSTVDLSFGGDDTGRANDITIINPQLLMVCTGSGGTFFVSLDSFEFVALRMHPPGSITRVTTVVGDGRLCIAENKGFGVLVRPPGAVKDAVKAYAERLQIPVLTPIQFKLHVKRLDVVRYHFMKLANSPPLRNTLRLAFKSSFSPIKP